MTASAAALPLFIASLTACSALAYILLESRDLGLGILCPLVVRRGDSRSLFQVISPFWDGNEAWLVIIALLFLTGFPRAFAVVMPRICIPLLIMVASLILRSVSYRLHEGVERLQQPARWVFFLGSISTATCQGSIFGLIAEGAAPESGSGGSLQFMVWGLFPLFVASGWPHLRTSGLLLVDIEDSWRLTGFGSGSRPFHADTDGVCTGHHQCLDPCGF